MMTRKFKRSLTVFFTFGLSVLPLGVLVADDWTNFTSPSGVFQVRFPEGYTTQTTQFMVTDQRAAHSEETTALIDQRPYKNTMKSYIVKFDQTIGPSLTARDISQILAEEFNSYLNYYKQFEGVVRSRTTDGVNGHWGGEIIISYRDPTFGVQSLRARILFNETTRLQQIVVGSDDLMNSYATRDFFDSLIFKSGISAVEGTIREKWLTMESPTGMFTLLYPHEKAPPYYTAEPTAKWDDKNELVSVFYNDPVRNEKIFFNVYGYQFTTDLTFDSVQEVLVKRHINRQRGSSKGIRFKKGIGTGQEQEDMVKFPFMDTTYNINPLPDFPYVRSVRLRSLFSGKTMIVMELMTSNALFTSKLADSLMTFVTYQPDKMHAATQPLAPSSPAPAPIDTTPEPEYPSVPSKVKPGENLPPRSESPADLPPIEPPSPLPATE